MNAPREPGPVRRVIVPVGGTDREFFVQEQAVEFAAALGATLVGLHVTTAPDETRSDLFHYLETQARKRMVPNECHILAGTDPADIIAQELEPLDLVVIGTRRMGTRYHLGSVAKHLVGNAPGPVQVVRLDD